MKKIVLPIIAGIALIMAGCQPMTDSGSSDTPVAVNGFSGSAQADAAGNGNLDNSNGADTDAGDSLDPADADDQNDESGNADGNLDGTDGSDDSGIDAGDDAPSSDADGSDDGSNPADPDGENNGADAGADDDDVPAGGETPSGDGNNDDSADAGDSPSVPETPAIPEVPVVKDESTGKDVIADAVVEDIINEVKDKDSTDALAGLVGEDAAEKLENVEYVKTDDNGGYLVGFDYNGKRYYYNGDKVYRSILDKKYTFKYWGDVVGSYRYTCSGPTTSQLMAGKWRKVIVGLDSTKKVVRIAHIWGAAQIGIFFGDAVLSNDKGERDILNYGVSKTDKSLAYDFCEELGLANDIVEGQKL